MPGAKGLDRKEIEAQGVSILKDFDLYRLPIEPFEIVHRERIKLAPGGYDGCFDARLEYHAGKRQFLLFYADERTDRTEGRIRFTIGHELGHYSLPEHRQYLMSGVWHGSHTGFVSDNRIEQEADQFSAALLMPADLFREAVARFRQRVCTLKELKTLADRLKVSITAAAIRYCELDIEASSVVLSRDGVVIFHVPSYDMRSLGFRYVGQGTRVPWHSKTTSLLGDSHKDFAEGEIDGEVWYENRGGRLWEEAMKLGSTGLVITYLTHEEDDEGD